MNAKKEIKVALIANPNTGKTSLLNFLTGMSLHVGNWPGKTVEKKEGALNFKDYKLKIIDLPGTYSLCPYSEEEKVARDFLAKSSADVVLQIIDINSLERNLLLTFELLALGKKLILVFNFNKEACDKGVKFKILELQKQLELPIVQIEANTGEKVDDLLNKIIEVNDEKIKSPSYLKSLIKNKKEISHRAVLKFLQEKIKPFYCAKKKDKISARIDSILLNKYLALPLFFLIIYLMFKATFVFSAPFIVIIESLLDLLLNFVISLNLPALWSSLLTEGVIGGVGSVLTFTPLIFILFFFISLLEDSGYLARTVIMLDRIFHKFGVSGQTFLPMILGFGCNVPAIMATRTIQNKKERLIAIFINSFMSCSARLPVYVLFTSIFFPQNSALVIMFLYLGGILVGLLVSLILSKIIKMDGQTALIIELPPYRLPVLRNVVKHAWCQMSMFIRKAGTLILGAVIVIWFLASLPLSAEYGSQYTYLGQFGKFISPIFEPLGFGHWSFAIALIFGLVAKEIIIGTLGTLHGVSVEGLTFVLPGLITPLGAISLLVFVLLYVPCLAAVAMIKKETGSWKFTFLHMISVTIIAWLLSFAVFRIGLFLGFE